MSSAWEQQRALTSQVMERVCDRVNLNQAYKRVKSNKGGPGIDGMNIEQLGPWIRIHKEELIQSLMDGSYQPQPVKGVEIPKAGGGMRQLGIPTVADRLVQQAILQILTPIFEPGFSDSSYGFRPKRSAHQALQKAQKYVRDEERVFVVDLDLEKFFDRVNHDMLMSRVARKVADKRLLKIIRRFLQSGVMKQGVCIERIEGTPQGGPLSPLLANILLDDLDRELEKRNHRFCRYADDCNIYVKSRQAAERVMTSVKQFLETKLKLRVNVEKSAVAYAHERQFLGYRLISGGRLGVAPKSLEKLKRTIREITRRSRGVSFDSVVVRLNKALVGWVSYFRYATARSALMLIDCWMRRRLRCFRLKQRKKYGAIARFLMSLGVPAQRAFLIAKSGRGWWRIADTPPLKEAMSNSWFNKIGLESLESNWLKFQI